MSASCSVRILIDPRSIWIFTYWQEDMVRKNKMREKNKKEEEKRREKRKERREHERIRRTEDSPIIRTHHTCVIS